LVLSEAWAFRLCRGHDLPATKLIWRHSSALNRVGKAVDSLSRWAYEFG
jgi:hypothetical protein